MSSRFLLVVVLGLAANLGVAHATEPKAGVDRNQVKEDFKQANSLYNLGRFVEAAKLYESVYERYPDTSLLYNIAQSYRLGGDAEHALFFYKTYLRNEPKSTQRSEVNARITDLNAVVKAKNSALARGSSLPVQPNALRTENTLPPNQPTTTPTPVAVVVTKPVTPPPPPPPVEERTPTPTHDTPRATDGTPTAVVVAEPAPPAPEKKTPIYKKWWLWTIVGGVVVVGVGVGLGIGLSSSPSFKTNFAETGPGKGLVQF